MALFQVWVHDRRTVMYLVDAEDEQAAWDKVEASDDADDDFDGTTKDSQWYVDHVEPNPPAEAEGDGSQPADDELVNDTEEAA